MEQIKITYITHNGEKKEVIKDIYKHSHVETTLKLKREDPTIKHIIGVEIFKPTEITTTNGTMSVLKDNNTTIEKEENAIKGLEQLIEQDKKANDIKSLKYHTMALNESRNKLNKLKEKGI